MAWTRFSTNSTKNNKMRLAFIPPLNVMFAVNGVDSPKVFHSDSAIDIVSNANYYADSPTLALIPKYVVPFGERVYFLNCKVNGVWKNSRAYRSSLIDTIPLTWTTDAWINFDDEIMGAGKVGDNLLVGCRSSVWYLTLQDQKFQISSNGCVSNEGICSYSKYGFWPSRDGMYASVGGDEKKISIPIQKYWDAIPEASLPNICADTLGHYLYVFIGTITVEGQTMTNVVFKYNILQNNWNKMSLKDTPRTFHKFVTASGQKLFMGDTDGKVYQMFTGGSQNGSNIVSYIETDWVYGSGENIVDTFAELWGFGNQLSGIKVSYKTDDSDRWVEVGELNGSQAAVRFTAPACRIKFLLQETSKNNLYEIHGLKYGFEPGFEL